MKTDRPQLRIPLQLSDWILESFALVALLFTVYVVFKHYGALPDTIPSHYNAMGEPDDFRSKSLLFVLLGISVFQYLLLTGLSRIPHHFNYLEEITPENAYSQYSKALKIVRISKLGVVLLFGYILWQTIQIGLGNAQGLSRYFLGFGIGFYLLILLVYILKARSKKG
ncbi:DUF1648 domain-containing protein [Cytophagales bacterium LB-30]|uniref:DUF1648 domain-containing protein n=1 Tax=Shiella aurantiaca TaxID=3058365 RepID=A0ABT8F6M2_9BACT|nr:DUF1648 domain-containing protein [Shiella aurantiaca]MDN4166082.1 DUF1648 domain-containing protein [Shiella aurantiaca]